MYGANIFKAIWDRDFLSATIYILLTIPLGILLKIWAYGYVYHYGRLLKKGNKNE